jgi:hypothetical protein
MIITETMVIAFIAAGVMFVSMNALAVAWSCMHTGSNDEDVKRR